MKQSLFDHLQGAFGCVSKGHSVDDIIQEAVQYLTSVCLTLAEMYVLSAEFPVLVNKSPFASY